MVIKSLNPVENYEKVENFPVQKFRIFLAVIGFRVFSVSWRGSTENPTYLEKIFSRFQILECFQPFRFPGGLRRKVKKFLAQSLDSIIPLCILVLKLAPYRCNGQRPSRTKITQDCNAMYFMASLVGRYVDI